jgi:hypothetical protein
MLTLNRTELSAGFALDELEDAGHRFAHPIIAHSSEKVTRNSELHVAW